MLGEFKDPCARHGVSQSVGRTGAYHENGVAECVWPSLKREFVDRFRFDSRTFAGRGVTGWINRYNAVR